jgi:hypothetical protein
MREGRKSKKRINNMTLMILIIKWVRYKFIGRE